MPAPHKRSITGGQEDRTSAHRPHMNRAFVREADGDEVVEPLYERQHSDLPNYITPEGLLHLKNRIRVLENSIEALKEQR